MTRIRMTKTQLKGYRTQLEAMVKRLTGERRELRHDLVGRDGAPRPAEEQHTNEDLGHEAAEGEVRLALLENEEQLLAECQEALNRIEASTFGTCATCGKLIATGRLEVVPYARQCVRCARTEEAAAEAERR